MMHFIEIILAAGDQLENDIMVKIKINSISTKMLAVDMGKFRKEY